MKETSRLVKGNAHWSVIKTDNERCYQLTLALAELNGGMEALNDFIHDSSRVQKFCGVRQVFDAHCMERSDTEEYLATSDAFDKGFSRHLQTTRKIRGKRVHTFERFKKYYARWKKENKNTPVETTEPTPVPVINTDFSGLNFKFTEAEETPSTDISNEIADIIKLSEKFTTIESPSGWKVSR